MYNWLTKFCRCWDLNRGSLVSEVTALQTEPLPLPVYHTVSVYHYIEVYKIDSATQLRVFYRNTADHNKRGKNWLEFFFRMRSSLKSNPLFCKRKKKLMGKMDFKDFKEIGIETVFGFRCRCRYFPDKSKLTRSHFSGLNGSKLFFRSLLNPSDLRNPFNLLVSRL